MHWLFLYWCSQWTAVFLFQSSVLSVLQTAIHTSSSSHLPLDQPQSLLIGWWERQPGWERWYPAASKWPTLHKMGFFFFFFCPEWLDAASRRITKTHSGWNRILVLHYYLRFTVWLHWLEAPLCWAQQLQTSTSTSTANNTPFNASGLFTVNVVDLYWLRCTISW